MASRSRYLTLEAWVKGLTKCETLDRFGQLREELVSDYLLMARAQQYWETRALTLSAVVRDAKDGWSRLERALSSHSESVYPWDTYERLELEARDPKAAARANRDRMLSGIDAQIERYVYLVETGELAPGAAYPGWKKAYQAQDPELFERVARAIEEMKTHGPDATVHTAPDDVFRGSAGSK